MTRAREKERLPMLPLRNWLSNIYIYDYIENTSMNTYWIIILMQTSTFSESM